MAWVEMNQMKKTEWKWVETQVIKVWANGPSWLLGQLWLLWSPTQICFEMSKKGFDCQGPSEREVSLWASHPIRSLLCKIYNALKYTWGDQIANQARCDRLVGVCTVYTQLDDVIKLPSVRYCYVWAPSSISSLPSRRGPSIIEKFQSLDWLQKFVKLSYWFSFTLR